ncbi:MAG: asparagine synthase (glutamine-hydrolyzing) [bacterium JZ-2024 1]
MCGLFGVFYPRSGRTDRETLLKYARLMRHRGPDGEGGWTDSQGKIGLGFRRLAIIDLETGDQPIASENGKLCVVFNGEIYNYRELRALLQAKGHTFRTQSDTEVILRGYEEWGTDCVDKLRGMFAIALVDLERKRIVLARDRFGIKPLYYLQFPSLLAFSSELGPLVRLAREESLRTKVKVEALQEYLRWGYVPSPWTPFDGIYKLAPGTIAMASWAEDPHHPTISTYRYWRFPWQSDGTLPNDWRERVEGALVDSVRVHLVADVPVGAFLSGGMDSSTVVALAAEELRKTGQPPLSTFSVIIRAFGFSEARFINAMTRAFPVAKHQEFLALSDLLKVAPDIPEAYDEPFADPSSIPTRLISAVAKGSGMKTVLSGDGGDEILGGYGRYVKALARARSRPEEDVIRDFVDGLRWFRENEIQALFGEAYAPSQEEGAHERILQDNKHLPLLTRLQDLDIQTYLPENNLYKVDRASMAHGLEVRVPLLDPAVSVAVGGLPPALRVDGRKRKVALKTVMKGRLPPAILNRKKRGFSVPLDRWLRGSFRARLEDRVFSVLPGDLFAGRSLERALTRFRRMGKKGATRLWSLYCLASWLDRFQR